MYIHAYGFKYIYYPTAQISLMKLKRGLLIDFEGIDGSGKAVQSKNLLKWLQKEDYDVHVYTYPDLDSKYGEILNDLLKGKIEMDEKTQLLTFAADIMKDQQVIRKELERGSIVLLDRYLPSTIAYQCAKGMPVFDALRLINMIQPIHPDAILWFDIPPEVGIARRKAKKGKRRNDVHDTDLELLRRVKKNYTHLCKMKWLSKKWVQVDGRRPIEKIGEEIKALIEPMLK